MSPFGHIAEEEIRLISAYLLDMDADRKAKETAVEPYFRALAYTKFLDEEEISGYCPSLGHP